jgi:hypothetical protein
MKKILIATFLFAVQVLSLFAYTSDHESAANFLAQKGIINDQSLYPVAYNLDDNITRREMLKVMMNLSGKSVTDSCLGKFSDMKSTDWGCKYAEAALSNNFIAANSNFRPDDSVTQIEALKMIMQAKGIEKNTAADWRDGYKSKAFSEGLISESYLEYDLQALRAWIFLTSARSYSDFEYSDGDVNLDAEMEELFKELFGL